MSVLAVDVCGTLFDANTTAEFCLFHHLQNGNCRRVSLLQKLLQRRGLWWTGLAGVHRVTGVDLHRALTIRTLQGETRDQLSRSAIGFAESLTEKRITQVHDLVERLRTPDTKTVLISNGLDIVIGPIARQLGLPWLASRLVFEGDVCAGRLEVDLHGQKRAALEGWLGAPLLECDLVVITDNESDVDILSAARTEYIIYKTDKRSWMKSRNATFIRH